MATANKLSVIPCGAMHADLTFLLLKPGVSIKTRSDKDDKISWVEVPTHCVLVETDEGKLLWDTSCPSDWEARWKPTGLQEFFPYDQVEDDEYLDAQLNKMNVGLDEIDYVVLSHLHFDHAGSCCGTPAARRTGRPGGSPPACRSSSPTTRSPTTSTSTPSSTR